MQTNKYENKNKPFFVGEKNTNKSKSLLKNSFMCNYFFTTKHFYKVLCCLLLNNNAIFSQSNLVPNSTFEQFSICPDNSTFNGGKSSKPDNWYKPDIRGAAYFNRCTNKQPTDGVPYNFWGGELIIKNLKQETLI
jgi:hypothetical protein